MEESELYEILLRKNKHILVQMSGSNPSRRAQRKWRDQSSSGKITTFDMLTSMLKEYSVNEDNTASKSREQSVEKEEDYGLIESPLLVALGHSTNIVIISLFLEKRTSFTRVEILEAVQAHKSAMEKENIDFSMSRVRDGKSTINFWIDHLVSTGVLRRAGMAASFELNLENNFVELCEQMYPREIPSILEQHPSQTVVVE